MKNFLVPLAFCLLFSTSCERTDKDIFFALGRGPEYSIGDIELYDTSAHMLYFKKDQAYFEQMLENSFAFVNNGEIIYEGIFHSGLSSLMPIGPFIWSPPMYGTYALKIDNWSDPDKPDVRKDPKLINILSQNNLLHSGLQISASSINVQGLQLSYTFTVTNRDQTDLMIIDPDKTGPNLFHYFTNGLYIRDLSHNVVFSSNIQPQTPDPWDSWKTDWLSELKSGDSKQFTLVYNLETPLVPGEYMTSFEYPGLGVGGQVLKEQLYQGNSRIWLGEITSNKSLAIP